MKKTMFLLISFITLSAILLPHEIWLFSDNYRPVVKGTSGFYICSGHDFPKSSFLIRKKLIRETYVLHNGKKEFISFEAVKKTWKSIYTFKKRGYYMAIFTIVKPGKKEPFFWGRAIIETEGSENGINYSTGEGLEIVPQFSIGNFKSGDSIKFKSLYKGSPVKFSGKLSVNGGKNIFLNSGPSGIVNLKKAKKGLYLITTQFKGKGCSLTFKLF